MTSTPTYYTVTLRSGVSFVATLRADELPAPGLLRFDPLFVEDRHLLVPTTSVECMGRCTEQEAFRTAKALNSKKVLHRLFGEVAVRLRIP